MFNQQNEWKIINGNKIIYDPAREWTFYDSENNVKGAYIPNLNLNQDEIMANIMTVPFNRVRYINPYSQVKQTPRDTYAYGVSNQKSKVVSFTKGGRCLNFESEPMPPWLEALSIRCRTIAKAKYGFDPEYNSAIIGKYTNKDDSISFHFDTEPFLKHHFCANVTLGVPRDFQFRPDEATKDHFTKLGTPPNETHEIKLQNQSLFFFLGLEHALPKRAGVKQGDLRISISFRNMDVDDGIANSFYYCRGKEFAIEDTTKEAYMEKFNRLKAQDPRFNN